MRAMSSGLASGPAMIEAGSPGARWISTKATVATTRMTGMSASRRRATYVFTRPASLRQPDVPEGHFARGVVAVQLLARHLQREEVAELHAADVLVEDRLRLVPHRLPPARLALARDRVQPAVLFLMAPPARPVALHARVLGGGGVERDAGGEGGPDLPLCCTVAQRPPVHDPEDDL